MLLWTAIRCSDDWTVLKSCAPAMTAKEPIAGDSVIQWAAVKTQLAEIIDPPQVWVDNPRKVHCIETIYGNSPGRASRPPMIRPPANTALCSGMPSKNYEINRFNSFRFIVGIDFTTYLVLQQLKLHNKPTIL